jgi:hypothetical protein
VKRWWRINENCHFKAAAAMSARRQERFRRQQCQSGKLSHGVEAWR